MTELTEEQKAQIQAQIDDLNAQLEQTIAPLSPRRMGYVPTDMQNPIEEKPKRVGLFGKKPDVNDFEKWFNNNYQKDMIAEGLLGNVVLLTLDDFKRLLSEAYYRKNI